MRHLILLLTTLTAASSVFATEFQYDHELQQLTEQRDKAIESVVDPINKRYQTALSELLRRANKGNSLGDALKIRSVLSSVPTSSPAPLAPIIKTVSRILERKLVGTQWIGDGKNYVGALTFRDRSVVGWTNTTGLASALASYEVTESGDIRFQIGQKPQVLRVSPDLKELTLGNSVFIRR